MAQGTLIILDIGRNVSSIEDNQKSFFENAKQCAARIIERKILSQGKSLIGVILLGSKKTNNNMAKQYDGAFKHIEILSELQNPTWKMIRQLPEKPSESKGDWFDALLVAADYYKNGVSGIKLASRKIVLMTNFKKRSSFDPDSVEEVLNGFKEEGFEVDVIGPDIYSKEHQNESTELIKQIVEATDGAIGTIEEIMKFDLLFHRKKIVNAVPWNVDLSIGPNIRIPVSAYVRLKDEPVVKNWHKAVKDPITSTASSNEAVIKKKEFVNLENQTTVEASEKIQGYHYGQKIIPFSDCDKTMLYQPGMKCLSVYGFTSTDNIKWQNLNGDGLSYVFGRKGDRKAQEAVRCLVESLHELNLVGIVRKIHNNNNTPKMFALMPVIDTNNYVCLSMAAVCYKEDIKQMSFPATNLKKYTCSEEQVNAFKELINAMDLTKAYDDTFDDTEAFPIAECVSPSVQYVLDCIAYRAMNPGKPLPKPREEIMSLFQVPPLLQENAKKPLEKLKTLFTLTKVEVRKRKNKNITFDIDAFKTPLEDLQSDNLDIPNMPKIRMPPSNETVDEIKNISTVNPSEDFKVLLNKNKSLSELAPEMIKVIESLIHNNIDGNYSKALDAMMHLRTEFVKTDPTDYNNWIKKLKIDLAECNKTEIFNLIMEKKLSFILKEENSLSTYEDEYSHEESQMYENDTVPNSTELTISTDVQSMFDD